MDEQGPITAVVLLSCGCLASALVISCHAHNQAIKNRERQRIEKNLKYDNCNIISVFDGKVNVDKKQETHKSYEDLDYKLAMQDDEDLVVYVYSNDETERNLYTSYIVSKIHVDDNGNVYFDEDDLSERDYYYFVENGSNSQYNGRQRTRTEDEN